jgi:hypothetical protein
MMTFTPYGTMTQTNPPAGNQDESDSNGHGLWQLGTDKKTIIGKFVEFKADHATGEFTGKGVIQFKLTVDGDRFSGMSHAYRYDKNHKLIRGPLASPISGTRTVLNENDFSQLKETL